jgi:hypothetical protein
LSFGCRNNGTGPALTDGATPRQTKNAVARDGVSGAAPLGDHPSVRRRAPLGERGPFGPGACVARHVMTDARA